MDKLLDKAIYYLNLILRYLFAFISFFWLFHSPVRAGTPITPYDWYILASAGVLALIAIALRP